MERKKNIILAATVVVAASLGVYRVREGPCGQPKPSFANSKNFSPPQKYINTCGVCIDIGTNENPRIVRFLPNEEEMPGMGLVDHSSMTGCQIELRSCQRMTRNR